MKKISLVLLFLASGVSLANEPGVSVVGVGEITAVPDKVFLSAGVFVDAAPPSAAIEQNNKIMEKILNAVKSHVTDKKDYKTSGFNLIPRYNYPQNQQPILVGYRCTNNLTITLKDISVAGTLIPELTAAGANQIGGISFGFDASKYQNAALELAMKNARIKADIIAAAGDFKIGEVISVSTATAPVRTRFGGEMALRASSLDSADVPIASGSETISATVTVHYSIKK